MVVVRGVNIYPTAIDELVRRVEGVAEYRVEVDRSAALTELRLVIEPEPEVATSGIEEALERTFREAISLRGQTACEGFIDGRPTLGVTASIGQAVTLYTEGLVDTVIFARAPDGNWVCNDDSGVGYNAGLTLDLSGGEVWTVFVGTYSQHAGYPETTLVLQAASLTSPIGEK